MKNIHIENSYNIWSKAEMKKLIDEKLESMPPELEMGRTYNDMYVEWWLHNIGYYLTKPFCRIKSIEKLNLRFKDVDLEERA